MCEFSPMGRMLTLGRLFFKISKLWDTFFKSKSYAKIVAKMGRDAF
jgi:hypothetical protein